MIKRHHHIELPLQCPPKKGVGRKRPRKPRILLPQLVEERVDPFPFFGTDQPLLAGVWIEPAHADSRRGGLA